MGSFLDEFDLSIVEWNFPKYQGKKPTRFWEDLICYQHLEMDTNDPPQWLDNVKWIITEENGNVYSFFTKNEYNGISPLVSLYVFKRFGNVTFTQLDGTRMEISDSSTLNIEGYPDYSICELQGIIKEFLRVHWKGRLEINYEKRII